MPIQQAVFFSRVSTDGEFYTWVPCPLAWLRSQNGRKMGTVEGKISTLMSLTLHKNTLKFLSGEGLRSFYIYKNISIIICVFFFFF